MRAQIGHHVVAEAPQPVFAVCRAKKAAVPAQHAAHLAKSARDVGHMVQHHVGDDHIEARIRLRQVLYVRAFELHAAHVGQLFARRIHHSRRYVGQRHMASAGQVFDSALPHAAGAAAQFEHVVARMYRVLGKQPVGVALRIDRVLFVNRNAGLKFGLVRVLAAHPIGVSHVIHVPCPPAIARIVQKNAPAIADRDTLSTLITR